DLRGGPRRRTPLPGRTDDERAGRVGRALSPAWPARWRDRDGRRAAPTALTRILAAVPAHLQARAARLAAVPSGAVPHLRRPAHAALALRRGRTARGRRP